MADAVLTETQTEKCISFCNLIKMFLHKRIYLQLIVFTVYLKMGFTALQRIQYCLKNYILKYCPTFFDTHVYESIKISLNPLSLHILFNEKERFFHFLNTD